MFDLAVCLLTDNSVSFVSCILHMYMYVYVHFCALQKSNTMDSDLLLSYLENVRSLRPQNLGHFIESYIRYMCLHFM